MCRAASLSRNWLVFAVLIVFSRAPAVLQGSDLAADMDLARSLSRAAEHAAESILPSVVKITSTLPRAQGNTPPATEGDAQQGAAARLDPSDFPEEFRRFFASQTEAEQGGSPGPSQGTGVVIEHSPLTSTAVILTSYSSVKGATKVTIHLTDGRQLTSSRIVGDEGTDIAIVRLTGVETAVVAPLGDSDTLRAGTLILAVGHPFGLSHSVSLGIVSGRGRTSSNTPRTTLIQTDAAANPGSAGGPLVNFDGQVVGMVNSVATRGGGFDGVAFAVPINHARSIAGQLIQHGRVPRGQLGMAIQQAPRQPGLLAEGGVYVAQVLEGGAAADAGIQQGDVVIGFAGAEIRRPVELLMELDRTPVDSRQPLKIVRNGELLTVEIAVREEQAGE